MTVPFGLSQYFGLLRVRFLGPTCLIFGILMPSVVAQSQVKETAEIPGGVLEYQVILLSAPEAAIEAYLQSFSKRQWTIEVKSRGAFLGRAMGMELRSSSRDALFAPQYWTPLPNGSGNSSASTEKSLSASPPANG